MWLLLPGASQGAADPSLGQAREGMQCILASYQKHPEAPQGAVVGPSAPRNCSPCTGRANWARRYTIAIAPTSSPMKWSTPLIRSMPWTITAVTTADTRPGSNEASAMTTAAVQCCPDRAWERQRPTTCVQGPRCSPPRSPPLVGDKVGGQARRGEAGPVQRPLSVALQVCPQHHLYLKVGGVVEVSTRLQHGPPLQLMH